MLVAAFGCGSGSSTTPTLDVHVIAIDAVRLRTDQVDEGRFAKTATFALADARTTSGAGAYVSLAGSLLDNQGAVVGELSAQPLWIPSGDSRVFALVDRELAPRPTAESVRVRVLRVEPSPPPQVHLEDLHTFDDHGQLV